jgi:predicted DNA binding CopG/RHH family protein
MPYVPVEVDKRKKGDQVRKKYLKVRLSEKELDQAHRVADQRGMSISEFIRECLFKDGDNEDSTR